MPEDFFKLFASPTEIRRFAALHTKAASIFNALAAAREAKDEDVEAACFQALADLAIMQQEGHGLAPTPSA